MDLFLIPNISKILSPRGEAMNTQLNEYGQPTGEYLENWSPRNKPSDIVLEGMFCKLEPLNVEHHAEDLFSAYSLATDGRDWTYMFAGPFNGLEEYKLHAKSASLSNDPKHYAVIDKTTNKAVGTLSLMRIDPNNGVIEVGNVMFSPLLKQKPASTEAQFLLMEYVFDELGYRRYEWKCDNLNEPSKKAAERLGFSFEGIFRQAVIYKGRTRDTAWFSVIDKEWPQLKKSFKAWLSESNFGKDKKQIESLTEIRKKVSKAG